jgi:hypothetical protein
MVIHGEAKAICAAYVKARGDMSATVIKDAKGNFGKYATLAAIVEATTPHLAKHGLAVVQEASTDEQGIVIETWLVHDSGAMMQFTPLPLPLTDRKPQAVGSCITYGRRYALAAICGLAPDDDDGQAAQDATQSAQASKPTRSAPNAPQRASTQATGHVKPAPATADQLAELDALGKEFYGNKWGTESVRLTEHVTKGAISEMSKLLEQDASKLISGIKTKLADALASENLIENAEPVAH